MREPVVSGYALSGISREDFAAVAATSAETMAVMEANGSAWLHSENDAEGVRRAFDRFGIIIEEDESTGAGVRLKFTRRDVKQLLRLEGEGGISHSDDAP